MSTARNRFTGGLRAFFGLPARENPDTPAPVVVRTPFMDVQRHLRIYLRALWNTEFTIRQNSAAFGDDEADKTFIEENHIHFPITFSDCPAAGGGKVTGLEVYRAAAAHAAAHIMYSKQHFSSRSLDKLQIAVISVIEDARVEALVIRRFPGLRRIWARQHTVTPHYHYSAGDYLNRLARALLDENYVDDDPWVAQGRELFKSAGDLEKQTLSHRIGLELAQTFRAKKIRFNARLDLQSAPYRDDNLFVWNLTHPLEIINPYRKSKKNWRVSENGKKQKKIRRTSPRQAEVDKRVLATFNYPEWNYRSQSSDPAWATLREMEPPTGELNIVESIVDENRHLVTRMKSLLQAMRDDATHRVRKLEEGDEIDINAAIRAQIDMRLGMQPDTRIMMRSAHNTRDISVLMLLDLSRSMNDKVQGLEHSALELTRKVSVLFADALESVGDSFAIHGFCSESRHNVQYFRLKDFRQIYDEAPKARLAGMKGKLATRMGAAIRHATHLLNQQKSRKKLLLFISDGAPQDVDVTDLHYLHFDTKESVEEARRNGIHAYCFSLDPGADEYVSRLFGAKNYMVVDHISRLPEKILLIYAALTR